MNFNCLYRKTFLAEQIIISLFYSLPCCFKYPPYIRHLVQELSFRFKFSADKSLEFGLTTNRVRFSCTRWCIFFGGFKFERGYSLKRFDQKMLKGYPPKFICQNVARGNAVQISSNFPAKRLNIQRKKKFVTPFK